MEDSEGEEGKRKMDAVKLGLFESFINQIYVPSVAYISQLSHTYCIKIMAVFQPFEFGKNLKYYIIMLNNVFVLPTFLSPNFLCFLHISSYS